MAAVQSDMTHAGISPLLHMRRQTSQNVYLKPHAPYTLKRKEIPKFMRRLAATKTPTNFLSSNFGGRISGQKLVGLKSHDHHQLLHQIIAATIRGFLHPGARNAVIRLGYCFQCICSRAVNPDDIQSLHRYVSETLCLLEVWSPFAMFDIMFHLIRHLVRELLWFGPVQGRCAILWRGFC